MDTDIAVIFCIFLSIKIILAFSIHHLLKKSDALQEEIRTLRKQTLDLAQETNRLAKTVHIHLTGKEY